MKNLNLLFIILLLAFKVNAQEAKNVKEAITKMDAIASKTGSIVKFVDFQLPNLKTNFGGLETRIRKFISGGDVQYFYQIIKAGEYSTKTASIAYEDLLEVIKAISSLKNESVSDMTLNSNYLENKFITVDGFEVGYYIDKGKAVWFLVLEKYSSGSTVSINDFSYLESAFNSAKQKIEEIRK